VLVARRLSIHPHAVNDLLGHNPAQHRDERCEASGAETNGDSESDERCRKIEDGSEAKR
jgi:hypothetical protein